MNSHISSIKVWKSPDKKECRVYVHTTDGREGCLYIRGNRWNPSGSIDGKLTDDEWQQARQISLRDGSWYTAYESEIALRTRELELSVEPQVEETTVELPVAETISTSAAQPADYLPGFDFGDGERFDSQHHYPNQGWQTDDDTWYVVIEAWQANMYDYENVPRPGWAHKIRLATDEETRAFNILPTIEEKAAFWNEFFERTNYIGS